MRFLGVILIIAGLAAAFGYPYYHAKYTNFAIGTYTIYDKASGYTNQRIPLAPIDAPMRIDFVALADGVEVAGGSDTAFMFEMSEAEGQTIRSETVRFSGPMGDSTAATTSAIEMNVALLDVPIGAASDYSFEFAETDVQEIPLAQITMKLTGNVAELNEQIATIGYGILSIGVLLFLFGGRRKKKSVGNAPMGGNSKASRIGRRADPPPPAPEKPKRKWGRGD